jgi:predicted RNA-binding Zn ribbon-like protein
MSRTKQPEFVFEMSGGALCLDFANTVYKRPTPERRCDHLATFGDLVAWGRQSGLITPQQASKLRRLAAADPGDAAAVVRAAVAVREAIFEIFSAVAAGREPPRRDLGILNACLRDALQHLRLMPTPGGYKLDWRYDQEETVARLLWPVVRSAADLLTSDRVTTVRECAADTCRWLFLDHSRSQSRRWCDMKVCGNRAKARRFLQRAKARVGDRG